MISISNQIPNSLLWNTHQATNDYANYILVCAFYDVTHQDAEYQKSKSWIKKKNAN